MTCIDKRKEEAMKLLGKTCRKFRMGGVDLIPTLNSLGIPWELWKIVVKARKGHNIDRARIKRKAQSCGIQRPLSFML